MRRELLAGALLLVLLLAFPVFAAPQFFTEHTIKPQFDGAWSVYATDVDGDGDVDVLGAAYIADDLTWSENDGNGNFTEHTIKGDFDGAQSVYAADLDGDEDTDVVAAGRYADDITWFENDGSQAFAEHTIQADFDAASCVFATDVDGDDAVDVLAPHGGTTISLGGRIADTRPLASQSTS